MSNQIERLTQADQLLADVRRDIADGRNVEAAMKAMSAASFAEAARVWAQQARLGTSNINHATVIKMTSERYMADAVDKGQEKGQIATKGQPKKTSQGEGYSPPPTLEEIGIKNPGRLAEARRIRDNYTDADLLELAEEASAADEVLSRKELIRAPTNAQRMQSSETNEWYTPMTFIEAARSVLGAIDLDPATSPLANETVRADSIYTKDDDGLDQPWKGRVWLNPPYGGLAGKFIARLADAYADGDVTAAICLVSSHSTDTEWFRPLWNQQLCFTYGRIHFTSSDGQGSDAATHGSVFAYFGDDPQSFHYYFRQFGAVVARWS